MKQLALITVAITLFLGGLYFYEQRMSAPTHPKKTASLTKTLNDQTSPTETPPAPPAPSRFSFNPFSLFGNANEKESGEAEKEKTGEGNAPEQKTQDSRLETLKQDIKNYLIASSQIPFPQDKLALQVALAEAEEGNSTNLMKIRDRYRNALEVFKTLSPPQELFSFHEKSINVTQRFITLLDDTIYKRKGSVKETWNSEERVAIINAANTLKQELRTIVATYQIDLPPDVLPY